MDHSFARYEQNSKIPPDRGDADQDYHPQPGPPGRSVSHWGAFCDDVAGFDPAFFGINEPEATATDPQHRLLLETPAGSLANGA